MINFVIMKKKNNYDGIIVFRTYVGTLYIAYCQNEIVNTIINYFRIDIKINIYKDKFAKSKNRIFKLRRFMAKC